MSKISLKFSIAYFAIVFTAGFLLGVGRVLWLVPVLGERGAELVELPVMLLIVAVVARFLVRRWRDLLSYGRTLTSGLVALALLLVVEFSVVLYVRGLTIGEYFATRDSVFGAAYAFSLVAFAVMPTIMLMRVRAT